MSVWVTEVVMRRAFRYCIGRSLWQDYSFQVTKITSIPRQPLAHFWETRPSQTCLASSVVKQLRFYSQDTIHSEDLEEGGHLSSSLPAGIQTEKASRQRQKRYLFEDDLQRCGSPSDVLDLTCKYTPTVQQISNCLTAMWSTTKKMSKEQQRYQLQLMLEHPAFPKLLQRAMTNVVHMRSEDIAYSLLGMVQLGVPNRSRVVQTFLRTCQEKLNGFDEKSLSILASCLTQIEENANVSALKKGMRLLVDARLPSIQNVLALQTMMRVLGKDAPLDLKRKLEGKALSMADQFTLPNAQHMISTMAKIGFYSKPLLGICSKKIRENLKGIPLNRLLTVLQACKELNYRDMALLTDISDYAATLKDVWSNKQLILVMSALENLVFCPAALMEVFAEKVITNPNALTLTDILYILKAYSSLNYDLQHQRQQFLDSLCLAVDSHLTKMSPFELLKTVYCLCLMGHFPSAPLQQLLQSSTVEQFKTTVKSYINSPDNPSFLHNQERMFQTVDLCLRLDRPPLPMTLTIPSFLLVSSTVSPSLKLWLFQSLRTVLEEEPNTSLQESVVVENFYHIDAVITKHLPNQTSVYEERGPAGEACSQTESSQRIAVIWAPNSFCYGTSNPRGSLALKTHHLKILGFDQVLALPQELQFMSEIKRKEYLSTQLFPEHHISNTQPEAE